MNFAPCGSYDDTWLDIYLRGEREPLKLQSGYLKEFSKFPWGFSSKLGNTAALTQALFEVYRNISERTFKYRLEGYLDQLLTSGFFVYSGYRFHKNGDITDQKNGNVLNNIYRDQLRTTANPFELSIRRDAHGLFRGLKS